jgi:exodeoxyribonuclease V alpha subunit
MRATGDSAEPTMKHPSENQPQEVLAGLVERVTYHNAENGFCVLRAKARGHRDVVTVVGHAATIAAGEWITASGEWVNDRTHGQQFKARFLRTSPPTSADGIEKYLSSGMIRGIGPAYAKKLLRAFGEKVFDVIEATPDRLREVDGIGPVRAASILAAWAEQKAVREIMVFLHSHGVGSARAVRIYKTYGSRCSVDRTVGRMNAKPTEADRSRPASRAPLSAPASPISIRTTAATPGRRGTTRPIVT